MALIKAIDFYGEHARIVNLLTNDTTDSNEKSIPLFERKLDVWYIAGFLGVKHNRLGSPGNKTSEIKTSVFSETVTKHSDEINLYTTLVSLKSADFNSQVQLQKAFLNELDIEGEKYDYELERMELFHKYALGGLDYISETILSPESEVIRQIDFGLITSQFVVECTKQDAGNAFDDLF